MASDAPSSAKLCVAAWTYSNDMQCQFHAINLLNHSFLFPAFLTLSSIHVLVHPLTCLLKRPSHHSPDAMLHLCYYCLLICLFIDSFINQIHKACVHCLVTQPRTMCTQKAAYCMQPLQDTHVSAFWVLLYPACTYDVEQLTSPAWLIKEPGWLNLGYKYRLPVHLPSRVQNNGCLAVIHVWNAANMTKCALWMKSVSDKLWGSHSQGFISVPDL